MLVILVIPVIPKISTLFCSATRQVPRDLPGRPTSRRRGALGTGPTERRRRQRRGVFGTAAAGDPGGLGAFQSRGQRRREYGL